MQTYEQLLETKIKTHIDSGFDCKTVWLNVIITIIGLATYLQSVASFDKYAVVLGIILTFGNLILKIWFNDTAIASSPKVL